ncbi:MAG: phosphoserine phosphatase [Treponema sp.]|nr:MAG: phosphoserine phosphatase [Treponema sp.]
MNLDKLNWLPFNRERLNKMIAENANQDNYAVLDWDYTCVFYDTQDSLFIYQTDNLLFKLTPARFSKVIRHNIPQDKPLGLQNDLGKELTAELLSKDLDYLYEFLYHRFEGLGGNLPLSEIKNMPEFNDFRVKLFLLMCGGHRVAKVDIGQLVSTGFNLDEYNAIAESSIDFALKAKLDTAFLASTDSGNAGKCSIRRQEGIRSQVEIQNLIKVFKENGIETYICTASQIDNIRVFASLPKYGYNIKPENVFGQRRVIDKNNIITVEDDFSLGYTHGPGKAETIKNCIMQKHKSKPPVLIAGDSDGDFYMMNEFKDSSLLLIFDKNQSEMTKIYQFIQKGINTREDMNTSIIVQSRDNTTGLFSKSDKTR